MTAPVALLTLISRSLPPLLLATRVHLTVGGVDGDVINVVERG